MFTGLLSLQTRGACYKGSRYRQAVAAPGTMWTAMSIVHRLQIRERALYADNTAAKGGGSRDVLIASPVDLNTCLVAVVPS